MTVNEALVVCKILQSHGFGDYKMTCEGGYNVISEYPDECNKDKKTINMEGFKGADPNGKEYWSTYPELDQVCNEIEEALKCMNDRGMKR